jgi:hypothetical protein
MVCERTIKTDTKNLPLYKDNSRRNDKPPKTEGPTEDQVRQEMDALRREGLGASATT